MKWQKELDAAIEAALQAREKILEIYNTKFDVEIKSDNSPVTLADKTADALIREYLQKMFPTYAFLTEESDDNLDRLLNDFVWIVDPVDGTKDFVAHDNGFTTNIALCYKNHIVVGVIVIPVTGEIYYASEGEGSYYKFGDKIERIHVSDKTDNLTCLTSIFHCNEKELALIEKHSDKITKVEKYGSSIKACIIARGLAEITYRMNANTKEWDTAACQIIVKEAGGILIQPNGEEILYNKKDVYNHLGYICINKKENFLL